MKEVVILANLGNRSVALKGDARDLKEIARTESKTFRAYTRELVEKHEPQVWTEMLELQILPPLLDKYRTQTKVVYLFFTKQDDIPGGWPDDDTEYSALLAAALIIKQWQVEVKLIRVDCLPIHNEDLMRFYRQKLLELEQSYPDAKWVIADAGGTPQQKTALKLVGEFLVHGPKNVVDQKIAFYNIEKGKDGVSKVVELPHNQFRKSLDLLQAAALIDVGLYKAADNIVGDEYLSPIFEYLDKRLFGFKSDEQRRKFEHVLNQNKYNPWRSDRFNIFEQIAQPEILIKSIATRRLTPALERLQAAQFYMKKGMPGEFLMALMHFAELFSDGALKIIAEIPDSHHSRTNADLKLSANYDEWRTTALLRSGFAQEIARNRKDFDFGFAFDLAVGRESSCKPVAHICHKLSEWTFDHIYRPDSTPVNTANRNKRKDLRALRNTFAHEGYRCSFEEIEQNIPGLRTEVGTWPGLLGLPKENYYLRANNRLKQALRELRE